MIIVNQKRDCRTITVNDLFNSWEKDIEILKNTQTFGEYYSMHKYYGWIIL
jgi:hypothetical protein